MHGICGYPRSSETAASAKTKHHAMETRENAENFIDTWFFDNFEAVKENEIKDDDVITTKKHEVTYAPTRTHDVRDRQLISKVTEIVSKVIETGRKNVSNFFGTVHNWFTGN